MKTATKLLALALLLALKPACGSGGGGDAAGPTGPIVLPDVVPSLPLDTAAATLSLDVNGMTDAAVKTAINNHIAITLNSKIVLTSSSGARTVTLTVTAPSGTTAITIPSNVVTQRSVTIDGSDVITFAGAVRHFDLQDEAQITLQRLKFSGARAPDSGAGVNSLNNVRLATFINCTFTDCKTTDTGPDIGGGAIRIANGTHTQISGCTFTNCAGSNGGAVNSLGTRLTIINSTFTTNSAFGTGGGAEVKPIPGNGGIGGAVYVDNVSNDPSALHQLSVTGCTFTSNQANDHAGALFGYTNPAAPSTTIIDRCTFSGNTVNGGHGHSGAIYSQAGTLTLSNSTLTTNHAASSGGAMFCNNDSSLIANCTFQGNTCVSLGGGVFTTAGNVYFFNDTFAANAAGDFSGAIHSDTTTVVQNCILTGNTAAGNPAGGLQINSSFPGGANLQSPVGGTGNKPASATGTTFVANVMLGGLANNGGPTQTMKPLAGSPAIDLVGVSQAPLLDQRGNVRIGTPDCGACEGP